MATKIIFEVEKIDDKLKGDFFALSDEPLVTKFTYIQEGKTDKHNWGKEDTDD